MTLPANDAFTLGLTHDPGRLGLHSSSAKLPFVTATKAQTRTVTNRAAPSSRRSMSAGRRSGFSPDARPERHAPDSDTRHRRSHPSTKGKQTTVSNPTVPIDWEIPRKTLHSSIGFLTLYLYASHGSPRPVVIVLSAGLAIIVPCDILRLRSVKFERAFERCVGFLMREREKKGTNGVIWYILGVIFVLSVYPLDIAVVSILILSWADTAASTIGRLYGSRTPRLPRRIPLLNIPLSSRKSVAGFIAASLTGACIAVGFWGTPAMDAAFNPGVGWIGLSVLGVVSGLISGISEALDLGSLDDNLTLPIISGGCLWGFFKLLDLLFFA